MSEPWLTIVSVVVGAGALAASVGGGSLIVPWVLRSASRGAAQDDGPAGAQAVAALRGGTWIGILERLAVTGCLLAGYPAGIAVVVAIKGLGRYPELRERPVASERFVIGTLASMGWAGLTGLLGVWVIGLLA
ncbi:hypothetical protein SAMN04489860_1694 [Paraoerskovia marina]|uniref:Uncharacterized protein n=1 Tax=Paraoerskovia marina TaxID=545619 RepID=A0A1H1SQI4_9CELL|nr:hypothetical protein [Paraoerskovia marina]SDS50267.1 hypothetical protein SAMN04489860_1694 [Paraoerskovia marina]